MAIQLNYATPAQLGAALREAYRSATKQELYRLAAKIKKHYDLGDFTDAQMRALFNITAAQWTTLKGKIATYAAAHDTMNLAAGE